jgi:hypothetical protein
MNGLDFHFSSIELNTQMDVYLLETTFNVLREQRLAGEKF